MLRKYFATTAVHSVSLSNMIIGLSILMIFIYSLFLLIPNSRFNETVVEASAKCFNGQVGSFPRK